MLSNIKLRWTLTVTSLIFIGGCAFVTVLDYPGVIANFEVSNPENKIKTVMISPIDFFEEKNKDSKKVCPEKKWRASVDSNGLAIFDQKTSTHMVNFLNMDEKLNFMNRGFSICAERLNGTIDYLDTVTSSDLMFASGATLTLFCKDNNEKWQCIKSLK